MKREPIPQHVRKAKEIEREQDANAITALLQREQVHIDGTDIQFIPQPKGIHWDVDSISMHTGLSEQEDRVNRALLLLVARQWVQQRGRQYFVTIFGVEQYHQGLKSSAIDTGAAALRFKDNVLTGSKEAQTERGYTTLKPAGIENPALNKGAHYESHRNRVEEDQYRRCMTLEELHAIALDNDCTDEQAVVQMSTGEIHECNRCGRYKKHHADRSARNKWKSPCITCRKETRP